MAETLRQLIDAHAAAYPQAPFLLAPEPDRVVRYGELRQTARAIAALLDRHGVPAGEPVAFMLPNGVSAASLFLGVMYAGRVVAPQNLLAQDRYLEYALVHSGTRVVFAAEEYAERLRAIAARNGGRFAVEACGVDGLDVAVADDVVLPDIAPADAALLMYTSGTTGQPKGVLLSHANLLAAGGAVSASLALTRDDRVLSSLPLYHVNGQCIATVSPLVSGGSIVMPHRFSVSQWWPLVERYRPTWINVVPTIIAYLLNAPPPDEAQRAAFATVRFARSASAPLPPAQHRAFEERFGIAVIEAMGLTETASVAFSNPLDPARRRLGSPGMPLGVEARVVRSDGTLAHDGEAGEIQLRGPNVMMGYYRQPDLTARAIDAQGWLATGDLGYRDAAGCYFITGRLKELIIKGGENIAPREVDEALLRHPAVLECAAVGVPDADYGQEILACVVLKPGEYCSEEDLRAHCLRELGRYKSPRYLRFVAELPKGASGKVQRLKLLELS
ncbi:MAG TPA: AMP-binding protein [Casimicrobiaceae bacterium]